MSLLIWSYLIPPIISGILAWTLAYFAARRYAIPGAIPLAAMLIAGGLWSFAHFLELVINPLAGKVFWDNLQFNMMDIVALSGFIFAIRYTGRNNILTGPMWGALMIQPVISLLVVWGDPVYGWVRPTASTLFVESPLKVLVYDFGPWVYFSSAYALLLVLASLAMLIDHYGRSASSYRPQLIAVILGFLLPWIGGLITLVGLLPDTYRDLFPVLLGISSLLMGWGMFRLDFLDIVPVAHDIVIENMADAVLITDRQHRVLDINPAGEELLGHTLSEIIGQPVLQVLERWPTIVAQFRMADNREQPSNTAEIRLNLDKGVRYYELEISPLQNQRAAHTGSIAIFHDMTARREANLMLQQALDRLLILRRLDVELTTRLDVAYVLHVGIDAAMRLSMANAGYIGLLEENQIRLAKVFGSYNLSEGDYIPADKGIVGWAVTLLKPQFVPDLPQDPDYIPRIEGMQAMIALPLRTEKQLLGVLVLESRDTDHFTQDSFELLQLLASRVAVAIENARMYEQSNQLVAELDAYAHTVAHDLKAPISVILGYADMMRSYGIEGVTEEEYEDYLDGIITGSKRMNNIINALLLLASVRQMDDIPREPLNMPQIVQEVQDRLGLMLRGSGTSLTVQDDWPIIIGYAPWIEEILTNYISNAIKYGGDPAMITVGADACDNDAVRIWVRDQGPGLTKDEQARLFQPFSRLSRTRAEGHGLGLSIVQRIAEKLDGNVGVESTRGNGSTFSVTLPCGVAMENQTKEES